MNKGLIIINLVKGEITDFEKKETGGAGQETTKSGHEELIDLISQKFGEIVVGVEMIFSSVADIISGKTTDSRKKNEENETGKVASPDYESMIVRISRKVKDFPEKAKDRIHMLLVKNGYSTDGGCYLLIWEGDEKNIPNFEIANRKNISVKGNLVWIQEGMSCKIFGHYETLCEVDGKLYLLIFLL